MITLMGKNIVGKARNGAQCFIFVTVNKSVRYAVRTNVSVRLIDRVTGVVLSNFVLESSAYFDI